MRTESLVAAACQPAAVRFAAAPPQSAAHSPTVVELESLPDVRFVVRCFVEEAPVFCVVPFTWVTATVAESDW